MEWQQQSSELMIAYFVLSIALTVSAVVGAQESTGIDANEHEAIGVAIAQTLHPNSSGWILIDGQTAIFPCSSKPTNIINLGNCSGMKSQDKSADEVLAGIKKSTPGLDDDTITDLRAKSDRSVVLDRPFSLFVKQIFWRPGTPFAKPADGSMPEFAVVVSRVGFDKNLGKALVYIGAVRWNEPDRSFGDFIFLIKEESRWLVKNTVRVWQLQKKE